MPFDKMLLNKFHFFPVARHWILSILLALQPGRLKALPYLVWVAWRDRMGRRDVRTPMWVADPVEDHLGLLLMSSKMDVGNLLAAYSQGVFPFGHIPPMKWWAPPRRMMLEVGTVKIERDVLRLLKSGRLEVRFDTNFRRIMELCAAPRPKRFHVTWISPQIIRAFVSLHEAGHAHSVEVYDKGTLVGGLYGVAMNGVFFTESQVSGHRNASKVALAALDIHLKHWKYSYNDGKDYSDHLARCGFRLQSRDVLRRALQDGKSFIPIETWAYSREIVLDHILSKSTNAIPPP